MDRYCDCQALRRAVSMKSVPIEVDEKTSEYQLTYSGEDSGRLIFRYCPFCGGKLPESTRSNHFITVPKNEIVRLRELTGRITTIESAEKVLGAPDLEIEPGQSNWDRGGKKEARKGKGLVYRRLSQYADIRVLEFEGEPATVQVVPKAKSSTGDS